MDRLNVYFFGDSICFGQGVSINKTWVYKIAERLEHDMYSRNVESFVANYSKNGNTTRMALERMAFDIQYNDVDILIVQFGLNDCNYWETDRGVSRVNKKAFEANLEEIIERAVNFGTKKIILNTNHPSGKKYKMKHTDITHREISLEYNEIIRKVAETKKEFVVIADIERLLCDRYSENQILLDDMIHLSEYGHKAYFECFYPILLEVAETVINTESGTND